MLVLSRRVGERIVIDDRIVIEVLAIRSGGRVSIGISAPKDVPINREELLTGGYQSGGYLDEEKDRKLAFCQ